MQTEQQSAAPKAKIARKDGPTKIAGDALVAKIGDPDQPGVLREYRYWVGVYPTCPVELIHLAGIAFPKVSENLIDDPMRGPVRQRQGVIGSIVFLDERRIRLMLERLPRTVVRFTEDDKGAKDEPGTGMNMGDVHQRPRRGHIITIPRAEDIRLAKARGKPTHEYVPRQGDEPAAKYMFAVLCTDQERGNRGDTYPPSLAETGLEWPHPLPEAAAG